MAKVGDRLPQEDVFLVGKDSLRKLSFSDLHQGRRLALFAMPSTFTPICSKVHLPSVVGCAASLFGRGIDRVACLIATDPFSIRAWADAAGAFDVGVDMIADPEAVFTKALGMSFDAPTIGLFNRSRRYALLAEDGIIRLMFQEEDQAQCCKSTGQSLLDAIDRLPMPARAKSG